MFVIVLKETFGNVAPGVFAGNVENRFIFKAESDKDETKVAKTFEKEEEAKVEAEKLTDTFEGIKLEIIEVKEEANPELSN